MENRILTNYPGIPANVIQVYRLVRTLFFFSCVLSFSSLVHNLLSVYSPSLLSLLLNCTLKTTHAEHFKIDFVNFHFDPAVCIPWSIYASCIRLRLDEM